MAAKNKKTITKSTDKSHSESVLARQDNGNIQITFIIPWNDIKQGEEKVLAETAKTIEIPGFRKGKAPIAKVKEAVSQNQLIEKTLAYILPDLLQLALNKHNIHPAIYPKFQLISANEGEDWQIRAVTCELPVINLGDYKNALKGASKSSQIWTPDKDTKDENSQPTQAQKEQVALDVLLKTIDTKIPALLIEEETNVRLSALLERLEKLGMNLDTYLNSRGKTAQTLRQEYEIQADQTFKLDLALSKIADENSLIPDPNEVQKVIDEAIKNAQNVPEKHTVEHALKKRLALDYLISLM